MSISPLRFGPLALLLCLSLSPRAQAQELDAQTRSAARELATEGSALYQQSDFDGAYDRFHRAYQLVQKPNVGIWAARSLVRAGRWVEASERYLELERLTLPAGAPAEQTQAAQDAGKERRELLGKIPSIKIVVEGAEPGSVFVSLNGQLMKPALIGANQPVDPGKLLVKGLRGEQVVEASIELGEGQFREIKLVFAAATPAAPAADAGSAPVGPSSASSDGGSNNLRLFGFIGLGVGGALLATGGVFGVLAASDKSDLDEQCPERKCGPAYHDQNDSYGTKKTISGIGIIGGAVLAAGGAALVLAAPGSSDGDSALRVRGYVTLNGGGVVGAF